MKHASMAAAAAAAVLVFLSAAYLVAPGESVWRSETVADDADRFVEAERISGRLHVLYRAEDGLKHYSEPVGMGRRLPWKSSRLRTVEEGDVGSYVSLAEVNGKPAAAYQDPEVGQERLVYAEFDGSWSRETVDSPSGSGLGAGMYAALASREGKPVIFYYVEQGEKFMAAERGPEGWDRSRLETDAGWHTSASSCGGEVAVTYRNKSTRSLRAGIFDGSWSSQNIDGETAGGTATFHRGGCRAVSAFHDTSSDNIVLEGEERNAVGQGKLSRVAAEGGLAAFNRKGDGLLVSTERKGWNEEVLDGSEGAGRYVDVESGPRPAVAHISGGELVVSRLERRRAVDRLLG